MTVMRIEMKELQEAMSDLVTEVESERAEHKAMSQKNDELEQRNTELERLVPHESEWTRVDELTESLEAKEKEVFDLSRANMVMESRIADLQHKHAESMVLSSKIEEATSELQQRDATLDALKKQVALEKTAANDLRETLSEQEKACSRLRDEKDFLQTQIETLKSQLEENQAIRGSVQMKETELIAASEAMTAQIEDLQQRLEIKDNELQVKDTELQAAIADLTASKRLLESGVLEASFWRAASRMLCSLVCLK